MNGQSVDVEALRRKSYWPAEALGNLGEQAIEVMMAYLREHHAPGVLIGVLTDTFFLEYLMLQDPETFVGGRKGREGWNQTLIEVIGSLKWGMQLLEEDELAWQPKEVNRDLLS